jgi:vacuolar protein sorting-associated protein 33A
MALAMPPAFASGSSSASPITSPPQAGASQNANDAASHLSQRALFQALDAINDEPRSLFLDPALAGALGLVTDVASLKQHGVERMFWLEEQQQSDAKGKAKADGAKTIEVPISAPTRSIVYICRPETRWMHVIAGE